MSACSRRSTTCRPEPSAFEAVAVVSDEDWLRPAVKALSLLLPGEAKAFAVRDLTAAKAWLAEGLDPDGATVHA
ncbi:STAS/SEC14 domain-containing protein [Paractinoplanes rishiriensis]|uniref:STAS/SEC14 domain-containing protein n=1 Tax=Paractinoplanes rishiriensis TaxID=1050105 RepID=UPI0023B2DE2E|nr:STAS/SEC14 domain-containing protein [Actinoplanes rishiriensis]